MNPEDVAEWSTDDVERWLEENSLHSVINEFREHAVDGFVLSLLRESDIDNLVRRIGPRVKFRYKLALLLNKDPSSSYSRKDEFSILQHENARKKIDTSLTGGMCNNPDSVSSRLDLCRLPIQINNSVGMFYDGRITPDEISKRNRASGYAAASSRTITEQRHLLATGKDSAVFRQACNANGKRENLDGNGSASKVKFDPLPIVKPLKTIPPAENFKNKVASQELEKTVPPESFARPLSSQNVGSDMPSFISHSFIQHVDHHDNQNLCLSVDRTHPAMSQGLFRGMKRLRQETTCKESLPKHFSGAIERSRAVVNRSFLHEDTASISGLNLADQSALAVVNPRKEAQICLPKLDFTSASLHVASVKIEDSSPEQFTEVYPESDADACTIPRRPSLCPTSCDDGPENTSGSVNSTVTDIVDVECSNDVPDDADGYDSDVFDEMKDGDDCVVDSEMESNPSIPDATEHAKRIDDEDASSEDFLRKETSTSFSDGVQDYSIPRSSSSTVKDCASLVTRGCNYQDAPTMAFPHEVIDLQSSAFHQAGIRQDPSKQDVRDIEVVTNRLALRERSKIFRRSDKKWHTAVNETAYQMVLRDPKLLRNKKELRHLAEAEVRKTYKFAKGKSRSIALPENKLAAEQRKKQKLTNDKIVEIKRSLNAEAEDISRQMRQCHVSMTLAGQQTDATKLMQLREEMQSLQQKQAKIHFDMDEILKKERKLCNDMKSQKPDPYLSFRGKYLKYQKFDRAEVRSTQILPSSSLSPTAAKCKLNDSIQSNLGDPVHQVYPNQTDAHSGQTCSRASCQSTLLQAAPNCPRLASPSAPGPFPYDEASTVFSVSPSEILSNQTRKRNEWALSRSVLTEHSNTKVGIKDAKMPVELQSESFSIKSLKASVEPHMRTRSY